MRDERYSLAKLMTNDQDFAQYHAKLTENVKKDKTNLLSAATKINSKYQKEIEEGTRKKQLLLSEGLARGLSVEEIEKSITQYIPTNRTPILNFLYFMEREYPNAKNDIKVLREDSHKESDFDDLLTKLNNKHGHLIEEYIRSECVSESPDMTDFIYDNVNLDTFNKIKKLKALAMNNSNPEESFLAFNKCKELCSQYNLDFSRIPCYVKPNK